MPKLRTIILWVLSIVFAGIAGWWVAENKGEIALKAPVPIAEKIRTLDKYTIENLSHREYKAEKIELGEVIKEDKDYTAYQFSFVSDGKKVTGQINMPKGEISLAGWATVLMLRGYAEKEGYKTGNGTRNAAAYFAKQGFLTIAPDFLGFGGSDLESENVFEARFETYTSAINLLASVKKFDKVDSQKIAIWAHSNGGQVATTLLEVTGQAIPTSLWAPVTKPFPYSILYYTDELSDRGKFLRRQLAQFEEDYDVELYSLTNYIEKINAPLQLHQGTADTSVPKRWSDDFTRALEEKGKDITYRVHPGADHNMAPAWNLVVEQDSAFFKKHFNPSN